MNAEEYKQRLAQIKEETLPLPGHGKTALRHRRLMEVGREDLSVARLAEAHWDAVAILAESGRLSTPGTLYGVWASELPGKALSMERSNGSYLVSGTKMFCSGAGLVDRALVTVECPEQLVVDLDLRRNSETVTFDGSGWKTEAFRLTRTSTVTFHAAEAPYDAVLGKARWYLDRPGFWHGACGPAACWAGGVAALVDQAMKSKREDAHTLAHLAAMHANVWALECCLEMAGQEIDAAPSDRNAAQIRALQLRHLVEQTCSDTLQRFARAYGPAPLSMDGEISRRYQEANLYLRQSHAERDLESLARALKKPSVD